MGDSVISNKEPVQKPVHFKAKYISDEPSDYFVKGKIYKDLFYPTDDSRKCIICYVDHDGEEYGISADRFQILDEE